MNVTGQGIQPSHQNTLFTESKFEEMTNPLLPVSKDDATNSPKVMERSNPYQQKSMINTGK